MSALRAHVVIVLSTGIASSEKGIVTQLAQVILIFLHHVLPGYDVHTDGAKTYESIPTRGNPGDYIHASVIHGIGEFAGIDASIIQSSSDHVEELFSRLRDHLRIHFEFVESAAFCVGRVHLSRIPSRFLCLVGTVRV